MVQQIYDINKVTTLRTTIELRANSPWDGCELRHYVRRSYGRECLISSNEMFALLNELREAGARLIESSEGLSRIVRVVYQ